MNSKRIDWESFEDRRRGRIRLRAGGEGPALVLVHGLGGLASNWRRIAPALAAGRRVVIPELPGHGGSEPLPRGASLEAFADEILAAVEAEQALPAPWVGHSLGGLVALRAAARRPGAVTGVVVAAGAGISSSTRVGQAVVTFLGVVRPGRLAGRHRVRVSRSRVGRTAAFGWWGVADPAGLDPAMSEAFLEGPTLNADTLTAGRALVAADPRADLDRVTCPCLCLWGTNDNWVPLEDGMEYARRLGAPLRTIADCGHLLVGERPDAVVAAVRDFLADLG